MLVRVCVPWEQNDTLLLIIETRVRVPSAKCHVPSFCASQNIYLPSLAERIANARADMNTQGSNGELIGS